MERKDKNDYPILVFDSGIGGISVLRELVKELPHEDFVYFGDMLNAPYGSRPQEEILELSFAIMKEHMERGIKAAVIACNTATSAAAEDMRKTWPDFPIIGIEPALKPACLAGEHQRVIVLATEATIALNKFHALAARYSDTTTIIPKPAPGLMEFVQRGEFESPALNEFLESLLGEYRGKVDSVVLGCTHYPFLKDSIRKVLGDEVAIYDGGAGTARETRHRLEAAGLLADRSRQGTITLECSGEDKDFSRLCTALLEE